VPVFGLTDVTSNAGADWASVPGMGVILTDQYAPVDNLMADVFRNR